MLIFTLPWVERKVAKKKIQKIRKKQKKPEGRSEIRKLKQLFDVVERGKYMWEATFDAIRDPVLLIDGRYRVVRANIAAATRSNLDIKGLVGQTCYQSFAKRKSVCPHCPLKETLATQSPQHVEIDQLMPDGDFTVSSYPMPQSKNQSEPVAVHHYRDVTQERQLQRKLIQSEKMAAIGMLAGGVAHEINNPLAGILAFTQLLKHEIPEGEAHGDLSEIESAAKRCKKIVEDLLSFSRPHGEGDLSPLSLDQTIDQILPLSKLNLRHRRIGLETKYDADLHTVRGNPARLQQVFLNLINNAAQSMTEGGVVTINVRMDPAREHVVAEVVDRGAGIKKDLMPKIFDPFFSTKERNEGTGLGLSICYSIIQEHGGKIEVESEEGKGSTFRVILPVAPHNAEEEKREQTRCNQF